MNTKRPTIVLVGLMGTGKSTVAWDLAHHLGVSCLDTDKLIEQQLGKTVREIFSDSGEDVFRDIESDVLRQCLHNPDGVVIAGAGGIVLREKNRQLLKQASASGRCVVVWLTATPEVLAHRTTKGNHRPLLDNDRLETLRQMAVVREDLYKEVADMVIDVSDRSAESVTSLILSALEVATIDSEHEGQR